MQKTQYDTGANTSAMAYRYCPDCDRWYVTADYTVDKSGETVCKTDGHGALHGYIGDSEAGDISGLTLQRKLTKHTGRHDYSDEIEAAKRQGLAY